MDIKNIIDTMSTEMYERLKHAAETGRWPDGTKVDQAQRDSAMQLSMAYQAKHLNSDEMLTVGSDGEIVHKTKSELRRQFKQASEAEQSNNKEDIARFKNL